MRSRWEGKISLFIYLFIYLIVLYIFFYRVLFLAEPWFSVGKSDKTCCELVSLESWFQSYETNFSPQRDSGGAQMVRDVLLTTLRTLLALQRPGPSNAKYIFVTTKDKYWPKCCRDDIAVIFSWNVDYFFTSALNKYKLTFGEMMWLKFKPKRCNNLCQL